MLACERIGRHLSPKPPGRSVLPLTPSRPHLPVPPPEEAWRVGRLEGHAPPDPVPFPLLRTAMLPQRCCLCLWLSPQPAVADSAWVLAASRGCSHRVNMLGDDLSCTQLALSRPMASVPSRAVRVPRSLRDERPLCALVPRVAGGGLGSSPWDTALSSCWDKSRPPTPGVPWLSLPVQLMKHAGFTVEKTGEIGREFSPTAVPPPVFCREVSAAGRWGGWAAACPSSDSCACFPTACHTALKSWLSLPPKGSPKSLVAGIKGSRTSSPEPGWVLVSQLEAPGPCLVPF